MPLLQSGARVSHKDLAILIHLVAPLANANADGYVQFHAVGIEGSILDLRAQAFCYFNGACGIGASRRW